MDRIKDNISLDHLARLLVDVQQDSSSIVDSIISQYQRDLLDLIFLGDAPNRNKVNLIIANEITPHLTAEEYMDKGEYENELKQVIGDTKAAYDISEHDTLVFGAYGLLVAGPNSRHHEPLLCAYLQFITIDIFMQNYFARLWILSDDMQKTNLIIEGSRRDPTALDRIRYRICKIAEDIIKLEEMLGYLLEALDIIEIPPEPPEQAGRSLYERLEISGMRSQLLRRTTDLKKNVGGASRYLEVLREMTGVVAEDRSYGLQQRLEAHAKRNLELQAAGEATAINMRIMMLIFAALLAFSVLDRVTGTWSVVNQTWNATITELMQDIPYFWFGVSMGVWCLLGYGAHKMVSYLLMLSQGVTTVRLRFDRKVFTDKVYELIATKVVSYEDRTISAAGFEIVKFTYPESDWGPSNGTPIVVVEFDLTNSYLLTVQITYRDARAGSVSQVRANVLRRSIEGVRPSSRTWNTSLDAGTTAGWRPTRTWPSTRATSSSGCWTSSTTVRSGTSTARTTPRRRSPSTSGARSRTRKGRWTTRTSKENFSFWTHNRVMIIGSYAFTVTPKSDLSVSTRSVSAAMSASSASYSSHSSMSSIAALRAPDTFFFVS